MAFPWVFEEDFDSPAVVAGDNGLFDANSGSLIDFPHYSELARAGNAPYQGAYCMRVRLAGGTTTQYTEETGSFDFAASTNRFVRWYFYLGKDFTMAASDKFAMFNLESVAGTTVEVACGLDNSSGNIRIWVAQTNSSAAQTVTIVTLTPPGNPNSCLGKWHHVEINFVIDSGGGNDGTIDAWYNDVAIGSQITALDQGATVDARFGAIGPDAGTSGTILFDRIILDDARIYSARQRFPLQRTFTKSGHLFIGPGAIDGAALLSTTAGNIMRLYDTDTANTVQAQSFVAELDLTAFTSIDGPMTFERGCYVELTGTNPRGQVLLYKSSPRRVGYNFPLYYSDWGYRYYGLRRKVRGALNV